MSNQVNNIIGEIVAISEEIAEFAAQGDDVKALITERKELISLVERFLLVEKIKTAPARTGTALALL